MNNNLYNTGFIPNQSLMQNIPNYQNNYQTTYVEEYLRSNIGKKVEAHVSFCDSIEWRDSVFTGTLENVGKDYIVIRHMQNSYVIWSVYIDYVILLENHSQ